MKSMYKTVVVVVIVMAFLMNPALLAWGNPPPGRWEKVAETKAGENITVFTKDGVRQSCRYQTIDDQFLTCSDQDNNAIQFEKASIDKIILHRGGSFAKKWAIWGAVGGAIGGALFPSIADPGWDSTPSLYWATAGVGACLGALGGGLAGGTVASLGGPIYISNEAALARAAKD